MTNTLPSSSIFGFLVNCQNVHDLRHTSAAILITNNLDPQSVAGVLGHKDPTTPLNIYSYFFRSKSTEASNIMQTPLLDSVRKIE